MLHHLLCLLMLLHSTRGGAIPPGTLGAEAKSSIIGGKDAERAGWPWMVHINITHNRTRSWRCGGSILNEEWVLTAAHCFDPRLDVDYSRSLISVGTHELQRRSVGYKDIFTVVRHDGYKVVGSGYENDLALVKLKKKLDFSINVSAISLPSVNDTFGPLSQCWITGWGQVGNGVPLPDPETLQELKIPLVPHSVCKETYRPLTSDMLCAGAAGKDACEGDDGDPLVCRTPSGYVQVGVMSFRSSDGCGLPNHPGIYTQVSSYLDFIKNRIKPSEEGSAEA